MIILTKQDEWVEEDEKIRKIDFRILLANLDVKLTSIGFLLWVL